MNRADFMPLRLGAQIEVRTYPSLEEDAHATAIYRIAALTSDRRGVTALALERRTEAGCTEVLRVRLLPAQRALEKGARE